MANLFSIDRTGMELYTLYFEYSNNMYLFYDNLTIFIAATERVDKLMTDGQEHL